MKCLFFCFFSAVQFYSPSVVFAVIFFATSDVLRAIAKPINRIEDVAVFASAQTRIAVLQTFEKIAAIIWFGKA